jgi:hypothetical protein
MYVIFVNVAFRATSLLTDQVPVLAKLSDALLDSFTSTFYPSTQLRIYPPMADPSLYQHPWPLDGFENLSPLPE